MNNCAFFDEGNCHQYKDTYYCIEQCKNYKHFSLDQLKQLFNGTIQDGNLISKTDRDLLLKQEMAGHFKGINYIKKKGIEYLLNRMVTKITKREGSEMDEQKVITIVNELQTLHKKVTNVRDKLGLFVDREMKKTGTVIDDILNLIEHINYKIDDIDGEIIRLK